jgi:multiple sugar transport system permease protein
MAAADLLAVRGAGAGRRPRRHRLPVALHHLDEPERVEGRQPTVFVGLANYLRMPNDPRFVEAVWHTLVYTLLSVLLPLIFGTLSAVVFHQKFPLRGFLRGMYILPMMATPVAIALVWTMMFHPQLGVLNYLLSLVGLPAQLWVFIPTP